jgi:hypothetical protein
MINGFVDRIVGDVVGGGLGTEQDMIAHVLLDETNP